MFDVRPLRPDGSLDLGKIKKLRRTVTLPDKKYYTNNSYKKNKRSQKNGLRLADVVKPPLSPAFRTRRGISGSMPKENFDNTAHLAPFPANRRASSLNEARIEKIQRIPESFDKYFQVPPEDRRLEARKETYFIPTIETFTEKNAQIGIEEIIGAPKKRRFSDKIKNILSNFKISGVHGSVSYFPNSQALRFRYAVSFAIILLLFSFMIPALSFVQKAIDTKKTIISSANMALGQFAEAKDNLSASQFDKAAVDFSESYQILSDANRNIQKIGGNFSEILRFIPGISRIASANFVTSAGEHLTLAGKSLAESATSLNSLKNPLNSGATENQPSLTDMFLNLRDGMQTANRELTLANDDINKVNIDDLPSDVRSKFTDLKQELPVANAGLKNFLDYSQIFLDVLGYNGPRKYLFLFENNQEMRATGGFIGSYGILDISNGRVKKLFVDDIYNPDGQLKARVIPPAPIQKMSAVWTMHDANWFPDFPTSAEKVAWFYEKTGGPTVDGVIAVTPELLHDLISITGPIDMPDYNTTIDADNFTEKIQQEVEVDYDKNLNQPKKFIADLTPKILDKVMSDRGISPMLRTLEAFNTALSEKHLLLYSRNFNIQKLISDQKWSGEILNTNKDYLSVIDTNINGYKTDGVIDETINHQSELQGDGSIVDTVSITRRHNGGNEKYDWWNKVNGDWMRVYVPNGAKLLEASGQTRELVPPALDYQSLGFKRDPQIQADEDSTHLDEKTGTTIYDENNKTVFANWVYVSPGESVTMTYKYILPFKLNFDQLQHPVDSFSVLYQKQSGSLGSKLESDIKLPDNMKTVWRWPDDAVNSSNGLKMETTLDTDKFIGLAVENK